jgi:hypothetical protein
MATTTNPLLAKMSGKLENIVIKQYEGKTVVSTVPDMSGRKLSEKQKEANHMMKMATRVAKAMTSRPKSKQRACEILQVAPNKVFRAIIKHYMLTDGHGELFSETEQESADKETLVSLKTIIDTDIPDAELMLYGDRSKGAYEDHSDWNILILTTNEYPRALKWELQENLNAITLQHGSCVNILLAQKAKWHTEPEYQMIRERITDELVPVKEIIGRRY